MDAAKRDMTLGYGGRTFAVRAYEDGAAVDGPGWHAIIIENRMPLRHEQAPTAGPAACFAEAVRFLAGVVEEQAGAGPAAGRPVVERSRA